MEKIYLMVNAKDQILHYLSFLDQWMPIICYFKGMKCHKSAEIPFKYRFPFAWL